MLPRAAADVDVRSFRFGARARTRRRFQQRRQHRLPKRRRQSYEQQRRFYLFSKCRVAEWWRQCDEQRCEHRLPRFRRNSARDYKSFAAFVGFLFLVAASLDDAAPQIVRAGSDGLQFNDSQLLVNANGNLTVLWQQPGASGVANLFAAIYDATSRTWSEDRQLLKDNALLHSVSGYYGSDGKLYLTCLATEINRTTRTATIDGEAQTVTNIPQDGRTDLRLLDYTLGYDLAVTNADLSIEPQLPQEGTAATATLAVHNSGDFAVGNFTVNLYRDAGRGGRTMLGTITNTELLRAGATRAIPIPFTMSAANGNIIAEVISSNGVRETSVTNNRATFYLDSPPLKQRQFRRSR